MAILARGITAEAATWELDVLGDATELHTMVNVTLTHGRALWGTGCSGPAIYPGRRINVCSGAGDEGPRTFIARVSPEVRAVVVTLSDGEREDLELHGDPDRLGARIAVLVYARDRDIHRVDLIGDDGAILSDRR